MYKKLALCMFLSLTGCGGEPTGFTTFSVGEQCQSNGSQAVLGTLQEDFEIAFEHSGEYAREILDRATASGTYKYETWIEDYGFVVKDFRSKIAEVAGRVPMDDVSAQDYHDLLLKQKTRLIEEFWLLSLTHFEDTTEDELLRGEGLIVESIDNEFALLWTASGVCN